VNDRSARPARGKVTAKMGIPSGYSRRKLGIAILFLLSGSASFSILARNVPSGQNPQTNATRLARDVFHNEIDAQIHDQSLWSYRELKEHGGQQKLFAVCQTDDGEIDRLLAVNSQELGPEQRQAEDQRIWNLINHPDQIRKKQNNQHEDALQAESLMKMFSDAFRFQYEGIQGGLIKLKFTPNPNFHPSGYPARVFHHMEGSLLVDGQQKRLAQINGRLTSEVKFFGGLFGHLAKGGTFLVRQKNLGSGHWEVTSIDIRMDGKALFFKTIAVREREIYSDFRQLPSRLTVQQALTFLQEDPRVQINANSSPP
jgi:hypothetical protein